MSLSTLFIGIGSTHFSLYLRDVILPYSPFSFIFQNFLAPLSPHQMFFCKWYQRFLQIPKSHLLLSRLHTLGHRSPHIAIVEAQCISCLHSAQSAYIIVLAFLVAIVTSQSHHCVHHMAPIVNKPRDRVRIPAVAKRNGQVFGSEAILLSFLELRK